MLKKIAQVLNCFALFFGFMGVLQGTALAKDLFGPCKIVKGESESEIQVGTQKFTIGPKIGEGGQGAVFHLNSEDPALSKRFILKSNLDYRKSNTLLHDLIFHKVADRIGVATVKAAGVFLEQDKFRIVKEFVPGHTLREIKKINRTCFKNES